MNHDPTASPAADIQIRQTFRNYLILALLVGTAISLTRIPGVFAEGGIHPLGNDGFYHATRMLAIADDPSSTHAFDLNLHWPEGLWVTWPWAYDYIAGSLMWALTDNSHDAAKLMVFYPLIWLLANIIVVAFIAKATLTLRMQAICMLAFSAAPLTLSIHGVGELDHNSAEQFWTLLCLMLTGWWLNQPNSMKVAGTLGAALGIATAFHNSLFIIQVPVLATLFLSRLFGHSQPTQRSALAFSISLLVSQFLVLLPSHHFQTFDYRFFFHSWFHLHVAALTAIAAFSIARLKPRLMWIMLVLILLLALPASGQILHGFGFIQSNIYMFDVLSEMQSPFSRQFAALGVSYLYSGLIWLAPLCVAYAVVRLIRRQDKEMLLALMVFTVFGLALLSAQIRLHGFGNLFLIIIPLLIIQRHVPGKLQLMASLMLIVGAFAFSLNHYLLPPQPGDSLRYSWGMPAIRSASEHCEVQPGLLLADNDWGNFFRYRTKCPLISNNFVLADKELEYMKKNVALMNLHPKELLDQLPLVRYVFVNHLERNELAVHLLSDQTFPRFTLLTELKNIHGAPAARLFRIEQE